ncbi:hypothetical protein MNV49_005410 [Pseudohyphozyma bogoriensis]|nr:hypothetical protein MNV49_005410 [Pseudohyphozyma bogoriensis]
MRFSLTFLTTVALLTARGASAQDIDSELSALTAGNTAAAALVSSALANGGTSALEAELTSALANPAVSSLLESNPTYSSLLAEATGVLGIGSNGTSTASSASATSTSTTSGASSLGVSFVAVGSVAGLAALL